MHGLLIYYFSGDNRADEPVTVDSEAVLDDVLTDILANPQSHPIVVYTQNRPMVGPAESPDHQLKFDLDIQHHVAAVHLFGPTDFLPDKATSGAENTAAWIALPGRPTPGFLAARRSTSTGTLAPRFPKKPLCR
ncbi:hypothetical protein [Saccharothrix sp. Mg75]|uniref:hypothetical protein n=1 Tax=Saccharothrix sp. Mg75 TaxID=3445357 RepID=UPI003EEC8E4F